MKITRRYREGTKAIIGYHMILTHNETLAWGNRPGSAWPGSTLAGELLRVEVDSNGLCEVTLPGGNADQGELVAIVTDHLPDDCRHLWPVWGEA